jgi:hypothetical protein
MSLTSLSPSESPDPSTVDTARIDGLEFSVVDVSERKKDLGNSISLTVDAGGDEEETETDKYELADSSTGRTNYTRIARADSDHVLWTHQTYIIEIGEDVFAGRILHVYRCGSPVQENEHIRLHIAPCAPVERIRFDGTELSVRDSHLTEDPRRLAVQIEEGEIHSTVKTALKTDRTYVIELPDTQREEPFVGRITEVRLTGGGVLLVIEPEAEQ